MHFTGTTPEEIYEWINNKNNGDETDYLRGKEDTKEAITVFKSLYGYTFKNEYRLFRYLYGHLCMREADSLSLYRSFIVLNNDEIITIRLSRHFATSGSTKWAFGVYGKPNLEYHLIINRMQPINPTKDLYYDRQFKHVEIKVREYDLSDFNDGHKRKGIIDEIIALLTNGTSPSSISENRKYRDMNLTEERPKLSESLIRTIIRESVMNYIKMDMIQ